MVSKNKIKPYISDRKLLTRILEMPKMPRSIREHYSALAQLVEQMTVNHWVAGSSPAGGAIQLTD